jgi:predicted NAD/FAD-dependent oxidoreductase
MSDAAPAYAPAGQSLISVSVIGLHDEAELGQTVQNELTDWFGPAVGGWRHLRTDRIEQALPEQLPGRDTSGLAHVNGIQICGDHLSSASIEGAVVSGQKAADAVRRELAGKARERP